MEWKKVVLIILFISYFYKVIVIINFFFFKVNKCICYKIKKYKIVYDIFIIIFSFY